MYANFKSLYVNVGCMPMKKKGVPKKGFQLPIIVLTVTNPIRRNKFVPLYLYVQAQSAIKSLKKTA